MIVRVPRRWELPEHQVSPRQSWFNRRELVKALGLGCVTGVSGCGLSVVGQPVVSPDGWVSPYQAWFPVPRNEAFAVPERPLTDPLAATTYNNFYEFTTTKGRVWELVGAFEVAPWQIELAGLCRNPGVLHLEDVLDGFPMEERIYRHRCVERWAMTVPWSGFPLSELVRYADPLGEATHVAFTSASVPEQMPGVVSTPQYPWPYFEGLTLAEATHELAFVAAGLFGEGLPRQNGAPLRLVLPWKYGYKSIKSLVRVEFVNFQPPTFWNTLVPHEYGFTSNVDPNEPHPRWSQATEYLIPNGEEVPTLPYNGYADEVAGLYA